MADYISELTGPEMDEALLDMANHNSEAWAVGERKGVPVSRGDETFQNNAKYYAEQAKEVAISVDIAVTRAEDAASGAVSSATAAQTAANDAESEAGRAANASTAANTAANRADDAADRAEAAAAAIEGAVRYDTPQTLTDAQKAQARQNIGAEGGGGGGGGGRNILDNAWFTINQRGEATAQSASGYAFDRWKVSGGYTLDRLYGLTLTGTMTQYIEDVFLLGGLTLTASVLLYVDHRVISGTITRVNGTSQEFFSVDGISATFDADNGFTVISSGATIRAVKLEVGSASTILTESPPSNAVELVKCKRFLNIILLHIGYPFTNVEATSTRYEHAYVLLSMPMQSEMYGIPACTLDGTLTLTSPVIPGDELVATGINDAQMIGDTFVISIDCYKAGWKNPPFLSPCLLTLNGSIIISSESQLEGGTP